MTHEERRVWLIRYLLDEDADLQAYGVPEEEEEQKRMLRALMNIRPPRPLQGEFLQVQDAYLQEENRRAGVTDVDALPVCPLDGRLVLWQGDMTTLRVDAIVNPANSQMLGCFRPLHGCADNIIHSRAGLALRDRCHCLMQAQGHEEPTGQAKITPGYNLPCRYVLHTVGPIVDGALTQEHERLLASCYTSCLALAEENAVKSLAFCCISTGVFMFPNHRAAEIAVSTVRRWLDETGSRMKVIFNVYKDLDLDIYRELLRG